MSSNKTLFQPIPILRKFNKWVQGFWLYVAQALIDIMHILKGKHNSNSSKRSFKNKHNLLCPYGINIVLIRLIYL